MPESVHSSAPSAPQEPHSEKPEKLLAAPPEHKRLPAPDVVTFKSVTKTFGRGPQAKVALHDVSFAVEDLPNIGELVTIVGPSGCGKSTLLRLIAGLKPHFPPTQGEVRVFAKPILEPGPDRGLVD